MGRSRDFNQPQPKISGQGHVSNGYPIPNNPHPHRLAKIDPKNVTKNQNVDSKYVSSRNVNNKTTFLL